MEESRTNFETEAAERYEAFMNDYQEESEKRFIIDNDGLADWAVRKIKEDDEEADRLIKLAKEKANEYAELAKQLAEKKEKSNGVLKGALYEYMGTVKAKETKTQLTYKLLSGTLTFKKPSIEFVRDEEKLIAFATDYVEMVPKFKWGEYKKTLTVIGEEVCDEFGEVVPGISVVETAGSFVVK